MGGFDLFLLLELASRLGCPCSMMRAKAQGSSWNVHTVASASTCWLNQMRQRHGICAQKTLQSNLAKGPTEGEEKSWATAPSAITADGGVSAADTPGGRHEGLRRNTVCRRRGSWRTDAELERRPSRGDFQSLSRPQTHPARAAWGSGGCALGSTSRTESAPGKLRCGTE